MKKILLSIIISFFLSCNKSVPKIDEMALFDEMMKNHYSKIFPNGSRNSGGPMFFKYIYENLASSHAEFAAYNKFYCGVSGSIIMPNRSKRYTTVKIRDKFNNCVKGNYYRCCWPCSGDIMKYSMVQEVSIKFQTGILSEEKKYKVLTINDPCKACEDEKCSKFPREVGAFKCKNGLTQNGLRVNGDEITQGDGRLIFALFHESAETDKFDINFPKQCSLRHRANLDELQKMGGMGNIFVKLALLYKQETFDVCNQ